jgi:hypothetical protein
MVDAIEESLPLAVLDFVGIEYGEGAAASVVGAVGSPAPSRRPATGATGSPSITT